MRATFHLDPGVLKFEPVFLTAAPLERLMRTGRCVANWVVVASTIFYAFTESRAQSLDGKRITLYQGYDTGGTYDQYARLFATHLKKQLPNTTIIVQAMPGAGGTRMLDYATFQMPKDGTSILIPPDTGVVSQLLENNARFDLRRFGYAGSANAENVIWVVGKSAADGLESLKTREISSGNSGVGSTGYIVPALASALLKLKVRLVSGYQGSRQTILAMERGEIDGAVFGWGTWETAVPQWFVKGKETVVAALQVGVKRDPVFPDTPLLGELVTGVDRNIVDIVNTISLIGRGIAVPPGADPAILAMYRRAFSDMLRDSEFQADADRQRLRLLPASGEETAGFIEQAIDSADAITIARARAITIPLKRIERP